MTHEEEIRARLEARTQGDWEVTALSDEEVYVTIGYVYENGIHKANWIALMDDDADATTTEEREANADFIANAPSDIDYLLKENQRLQQSIEDWISGEQGRKLREENQRLRDALEWYKDERNYRVSEYDEDDISDVQLDRGKIARQALEDN